MSGTEITVHVNRTAANTLETDVESFETDRQLGVVLCGHERPAHVHCRLGGDLGRIASIEQSNYYIATDDSVGVPIDVNGNAIDEPVSGYLEFVTGYGSESVSVDVTLLPPSPEIEVDETLTKPNRERSDSPAVDRALAFVRDDLGVDSATLAVLALGAFALAVAVATTATVGSFVAVFGLAIVLGGVAIAVWLLL
ncbi:DUF7524 family protein [Natrarchaeobaculum sulfurireducens]|uniref:Uncharacterized protein n=1 Tax=Natrarchaeobaculum sulfurireducens TaxID=2044521 RepID=A0A346PQD5_9EURY|nr:hypothetical protein [Natrarchaeobaculum sulfurireducens]AXR81730.1 hypothetical protein AArcMg_1720 [Natrarchaeobaculum sulfurireducens]